MTDHTKDDRTFDPDAIPENLTFTKTEWDVLMAGRAARLIAAGEMRSLEELLTAMHAAVEKSRKLRGAK